MAENIGASFSIDINNLKAGLNTANKLIRESQSEFKAAAAGLDDWRKSEEGLTARNKMLTSQIEIQREKVSKLKNAYQNELANGLDKASDRAIQLRTQIKNEEAALKTNEAELKRNTQALDKLGDEAVDTGDKIEKSGSAWEKFGGAAKAAAKVALAAVAAIGTGVVALTKQAVESYAEYEQLIGGVETLFGAGGQSLEEYAKSVGKSVGEVEGEYKKLMGAQSTLIKNANNAYKTAGMSANEYMSNVTSFSASLISSLGGDTEKAAAAADRAMTDISDNANKMGTDMQSIVDTYQSLARGNYQMLDNLKLGYGGTKSEMERMIADANKVKEANGEMANLSVDSFADVTEAIHIIQNEMGITGTTAEEASSTISGSVGAMKAAWQNLLTGIADDTQDFDQLINNFVDSFDKAAKNILPRVATALKGVVRLVEKLVPQIPPLLNELLPIVLDGVMNVVQGLVQAFPSVISTILEIFPQLVSSIISMAPMIQSAILDIIIQVIQMLSSMIPTIVNSIMMVLPQLIDRLISAIPQLLNAAIQLLSALVKAIPVIVTQLLHELPSIIETICSTLLDNLPLLLDSAIELLMSIVDAIPVVISALLDALPEIINTLISTLFNEKTIGQVINGAIQLLMGIINAIPTIISSLVNALPEIINTLVKVLTDPNNLQMIIRGSVQLLMGIIKAIPQIIVELVKNLPQIIASIVQGLIQGIPELFKVGGELIKGLWEGIADAGKWLWEKISGFFGGIIDGIKEFFGIASPSKLMEKVIGKNLALGIGEGFTDEMKNVNRDIVRSLSDLENIDVDGLNSSLEKSLAASVSVNGQSAARSVTVNQYNTYSQPHTRYEIYKSKQLTAAAVRLAMGTV